MEDCKHRKCSLYCDYISNTDDPHTGDILCFCNYGNRRYVGFIEDVDHGVEGCFFPCHQLSDHEQLADIEGAWSDFVDALKETEMIQKFQSLIDWIDKKVHE